MKRRILVFTVACIIAGYLSSVVAQQRKDSQQRGSKPQPSKETEQSQKAQGQIQEAIKKLATNDPVERGFGLVSLIKMGPKAAKIGVATLLGRTKSPQAVDPLIQALLNETTTYGCDDIARALANINDPRAIEPIIISSEKVPDEIRNNRDRGYVYVSYAREEALKKLTGESFSETGQWRQWWESNKKNFNKN